MDDKLTPRQLAEIKSLSEDRDLDKTRKSRLSEGEQEELDVRDELQGRQPFTPEQRAELDARADTRDWDRPRRSRFSEGEQGELDETAKNLQFNEIQQKELTRRFRKRLLPFVAYGILVVAITVGFIKTHANEARDHRAVIAACHYDNQFRDALKIAQVDCTKLK